MTKLPDVTARQVVDGARRRWTVDLLVTDLQGASGLGPPPGTNEPKRVERSVAVAILTSLMLLKFRRQDIPERGPGSSFTLQRTFAWQSAQAQLERAVEQRLLTRRQARRAA